MSDTQKTTINVFFIAILATVVVVGAAVYFVLPREPNAGVVEGRDRPVTGEAALTMDAFQEDLVLIDHQYEPQRAVVSGSVMNNSEFPFVRVEASFALYGEGDERVEDVTGFTSRVGPGQTWRFSIPVPPEADVARVEPAGLRGAQQAVTSSQADPVYPRSDTVGADDRANLRNPVVPRAERDDADR